MIPMSRALSLSVRLIVFLGEPFSAILVLAIVCVFVDVQMVVVDDCSVVSSWKN